MVVGIPSSVTIVEEDDINVCELSNSVTDSTSILPTNAAELTVDITNTLNELPFDLLANEDLLEQGFDLTDGYIYLTNYRLFTFSNQSSAHISFISCPTRLIESIEIKENIYLSIQCKDIRSFRLIFTTPDKCNYWAKKLTEFTSTPVCLDDLFAVKYASARSQSDNLMQRDYLREEFTRLQLNQFPWRITEINHDYKFSPSYPNICVVPASITDDEVQEVAKFRSYKRFPTAVWRHANGAVIARTSQPEVGWLFWRSKEDEKMIQAIMDSCRQKLQDSNTSETTKSNRLLIIDARSYTAALANRAKGGGFEHPPYYSDCDVEFMNLPNIHAIRKSAQTLRAAVINVTTGESWSSQLESSKWLHNLSSLMTAASYVVTNIHNHARPVLIHCSDGWDRTPQITTLAEIMLDSYYRTIEGFQTLIQREWIAFGHKFADRCGHSSTSNDTNERSPVFLQLLDCVYQIYDQNPSAFEFNEIFLLKLAYHTYSCLYGTFLCNTDAERTLANLESRTLPVWNLIQTNLKQFINPSYNNTIKDVLYPSSSVRDLKIWSNLYLRDIRYTPMGSSVHISKTVPTRIRSCEDIPASTNNSLHRSMSCPIFNSTLPTESSLTAETTNQLSLSNPQQSQFARSQNSASTNSLFGQPHQLGTLNDSRHNVTNNLSTNQTSPQLNHSSDNRIKPQNGTNDDSSPDITQIASSFQRFSLNISSVDSISKVMARPRKHTNSTSSTTSSLSEAWSLTRINSYDPNQTQRMIQQLTSGKIMKLIRKRIDTDGLTKISEQLTLRTLEKERKFHQKIEILREHERRMQRFVYTVVSFNNNHNNTNQQMSPRIDIISESNINTLDTMPSSSWQKIDNTDMSITRWTPDFTAQTYYLCQKKFQPGILEREHSCRKCKNGFCTACTNSHKMVSPTSLNSSMRACRDCASAMEDSSSTTIEPTRSTAHPIPIQNGCRQATGASNGSFNSPGGQKVKG